MRFEHLSDEQTAAIQAAADQAATAFRQTYIETTGRRPSRDMIEAFNVGFFSGTAGATNGLVGALERLDEDERRAVARAFAAESGAL